MGMDTQISEDVVEEASPSVKAPAAKPAAKKPGRPVKAYEKKAKPVGVKKL